MKRPEIKSALMNTAKVAPVNKISRDELARQITKMREHDAEMVTGIFKNNENKATGGSLGSLSFGIKLYPGDDFVFYEMRDGERYCIPRGVAKHINNNCYYKEYQHLKGEFGEEGIRGGVADGLRTSHAFQASRKIHRFAFHSLEYMDNDEDMTPINLVEVTAVH